MVDSPVGRLILQWKGQEKPASTLHNITFCARHPPVSRQSRRSEIFVFTTHQPQTETSGNEHWSRAQYGIGRTLPNRGHIHTGCIRSNKSASISQLPHSSSDIASHASRKHVSRQGIVHKAHNQGHISQRSSGQFEVARFSKRSTRPWP